MHFIRLAPLVLFFALCAPALAAAQGPESKSGLADNAALQYWQAFAQMPTLDEGQKKILEQWQTVSVEDAAVIKLIDASNNSLMYLHRASALPRCDWGLNYDDGVSLMLPYLTRARDLARLAALRARQEFERGNRKAARDDATAIMTLARHAGSEPIMVCILVRYNLEGLVVDLVAPYVPHLKASYADAVAAFRKQPSAPSVVDSIPVEKKYFAAWILKKLKEEEARKKGAGLELWKKLLDAPEIPPPVKQVSSSEEAIRMTEELLPIYDEIAKLVALPKPQFDSQYPTFNSKTKERYPLASTILPAIDMLMAKEQRNHVRLEMLFAAIAVAEGGPEKVKDSKDPFGDGPFEYKSLNKGFELRSKLTFEGQPVTLAIGQRN